MGSTHNFMDSSIVKKAKLKVQLAKGLIVKVADGQWVWV